MSAESRVCGIVQAHNEWPLLGVSVTHALLNHVDEVYVCDHASSDGTREGLRALQKRWPGRVYVVEFHADEFWQEAWLSAVLAVCAASAPDWIYVFDADEFMLVDGPEESLGEVLASVEQDRVSVRYAVQNYVAPCDFDHARLRDYGRLRARAVTRVSTDVPKIELIEGIKSGSMNYFDVPFQSKIVFRAGSASWLAAGTHDAKTLGAGEREVWSDGIRAAHLPLLSRARLEPRAEQGRKVAIREPAPDVSWQSRLVWMLSSEGRLDEFWTNHSLAAGGIEPAAPNPPVTEVDESLARALSRAVEELEKALHESASVLEAPPSIPPPSSPSVDTVGLEAVAGVIRDIQLTGDALKEERDGLASRVQQLQGEVDALGASIDSLHRESESQRRVADSLRHDAEQSRHDAEQSRHEAELLRREADACRDRLDVVRNSRSWRITAPLRVAGSVVRGVIKRERRWRGPRQDRGW